MKLATFSHDGHEKIGLISREADRVLDIRAAAGTSQGQVAAPTTMLDLIEAGPAALDRLNDIAHRSAANDALWHPLATVKLLPPLVPRQLRDFAGFRGHLIDGPYGLQQLQARDRGEPAPPRPSSVSEPLLSKPLFYFGNRLNVVGQDADIAWPQAVKLLDFELEIGACIWRTAKDIPRADAENHIFGYTIFNDVSARDVQSQQTLGGLGPCKAKSYDGFNVLGPWIVTRDELPSPYGQKVSVRVNGETWVETIVADALHDFSSMITFASAGEMIFAGEVFGSGTVSGCCGLEMDRWIRGGDVVELEVEGIGTLRNRYI